MLKVHNFRIKSGIGKWSIGHCSDEQHDVGLTLQSKVALTSCMQTNICQTWPNLVKLSRTISTSEQCNEHFLCSLYIQYSQGHSVINIAISVSIFLVMLIFLLVCLIYFYSFWYMPSGNLVEIRIPKKFSVCIYILISLQGLSKVFWKFKNW